MIRLLAIVVLLFSASARADIILVNGTTVYAVKTDSGGAVTQERAEAAQFVGFKVVETAASSDVTVLAVGPLKGVKWLPKARKPKIPRAEGCGKNPRSWLYKAEIVGSVAKPAPTYQLEVPAGFTPSTLTDAEKQTLKAAMSEDRVDGYVDFAMPSAKVFASGSERLVVARSQDELNFMAAFFTNSGKGAWSVKEYTLSENCP